MGLFDSLPTRSNGQDIEASWFNILKTTLNSVFDAFTLNDISDVDISSPTNGQTLVYNSISGNWENGAGGGGGGLGQLENIAFIGKGTAGWEYSPPAGNVKTAEQAFFPSEENLTTNRERGFTFTPSQTGELAFIVGKIVDRGSANNDGLIRVRVYATDGGGLPTGAPLDTSTNLSTGAIGLNVVVTNNFIFSGNVTLNSGTKYAALFESTDSGTVNIFRADTNESNTENVIEISAGSGTFQADAVQNSFFHEVWFDNLASGGTLTLSDTCYISVPELLQNRHKIASGAYSLNDNQVLWVTVNRSAVAEGFVTVNQDFITNVTPDGNKLIIAQNVDGEAHIGIADPQRIRNGETIDLQAGRGLLRPNGSLGAPIEVDPSAGLTPSNEHRQVIYLESNGGSQTVTANPSIAAGSRIGQELILVGTSDANQLTFNDGNGLQLNGPLVIKQYQSAHFFWSGSDWQEISRRG